MPPAPLEFLVRRASGGGWVVCSPGVGIWRGMPAEGTPLGSVEVGVLLQGPHRIPLRLPAGTAGLVRDALAPRGKALAVEWGQELFRLSPQTGSDAGATATGGSGPTGGDGREVRAPTDGVFYSRPSPDAPPFVGPGDAVVQGQPIGLIEVMKTFHQVRFEGQGVPASAVIEAVLVEDGDEVRADDALIRYRADSQ